MSMRLVCRQCGNSFSMTMTAGCDSYTQLLLLHRICVHAESATSGSVLNQEFCFPKAAGKTGDILDSKTALETISKHLIFKKNVPLGGYAPTFCVSLLFYSPDLCPPNQINLPTSMLIMHSCLQPNGAHQPSENTVQGWNKNQTFPCCLTIKI